MDNNIKEMGLMEVKCDNEDCDYIHKGVSISNMGEWVNKPCPKCGQNLCNQETFDLMKSMVDVFEIFEGVSEKVTDDQKKFKVKLGVNAGKKMDIDVEECDDCE